jgi:hypothetical protein
MSTWDNWEFKTSKAVVAPFSPGQAVYVDGMLSTLYYRSKDAGILDRVFWEDVNHDKFIRMFDESKKVLQILCELKHAGEEEERIVPVGYSWVELPKGVDGARGALCGFAFFKRSRVMRDLGMLGAAYWIKGLKIDVIHGVMLESNSSAKLYSEAIGFKHIATVPNYIFYQGKLVNARVMMLEADSFLPRFEEWHAKENPVESTS